MTIPKFLHLSQICCKRAPDRGRGAWRTCLLLAVILLGASGAFAQAAAPTALAWCAAEWLKNGHASALGAISGAVAGLVAVTPAAGFVGPMPALVIRHLRGRVLLLDGDEG